MPPTQNRLHGTANVVDLGISPSIIADADAVPVPMTTNEDDPINANGMNGSKCFMYSHTKDKIHATVGGASKVQYPYPFL